MNKIAFIFSGTLTLLGIIFLFVSYIVYTSLRSFIPTINESLLPGRLYCLDFTVPSIIGIVCIIVGIIMCCYFYRKDSHGK